VGWGELIRSRGILEVASARPCHVDRSPYLRLSGPAFVFLLFSNADSINYTRYTYSLDPHHY